jgi:hypothetical protein
MQRINMVRITGSDSTNFLVSVFHVILNIESDVQQKFLISTFSCRK